MFKFADPITKREVMLDGKLKYESTADIVAHAQASPSNTYTDALGNVWGIQASNPSFPVEKDITWQARAIPPILDPDTKLPVPEFGPRFATELAYVLENIDQDVIAYKIKHRPSGVPWWLIALGFWALSEHSKRSR